MDLSERAGVAFTVGYSISGLLLAVSGIQFGLLREDWFESRSSDEKLITINRLSMFFSVAAGIGLFWISFTPWDESFLLHIVLANVIFLGSISWAICITICTWVMSKEDERFESSVTMRTGFSAMGLFGLFGMAERFMRFNGLTLNFDALRGRLGERVGECISLGDSLLSQAAAFEWLFAGSMALVVASLIPEIEILTVSESEEA
tara:strand:- start:557 stop:1171 length:615 start_codon:yes stop_codon:yes gene_type:complete